MTIITVEGSDEKLLPFLIKLEELGFTAKENGEIITTAKLKERINTQTSTPN